MSGFHLKNQIENKCNALHTSKELLHCISMSSCDVVVTMTTSTICYSGGKFHEDFHADSCLAKAEGGRVEGGNVSPGHRYCARNECVCAGVCVSGAGCCVPRYCRGSCVLPALPWLLTGCPSTARRWRSVPSPACGSHGTFR